MSTALQTYINKIQNSINQEIGISDWLQIEQSQIDAFADVTEDWQYIHVDPDRAANGPFGATIAHGFLTLSMLTKFFSKFNPELTSEQALLNYGFEKVRFLSPVTVGEKLRGRFVPLECVERSPGQWKLVLQATIEIEGKQRPALVAEWIFVIST